MSLVKKLAGETAIYGMSSILGRVLNMLLVPFYTRVLATTHEYGAVIDLYATSAFVMVLFSYRMESAFFRFGTSGEDRMRTYSTGLMSLLGSSAAWVLLLLVFEQPIAELLCYSDHPEYIRWFAWIMAFDSLAELPFARLRLEQRPIVFVSVKLANIFINIGMNLFWLVFCPWAAAKGWSWVHWLWAPGLGVGYIFLSNLIASLATLALLTPSFRGVSWQFDRVLWWKMVVYSAPLIIVTFSGIVGEMFSRSMLKYLLPGTTEENLSAVGIFGANYKLAALISLFTQAYRYAAEPFFFRHAGDSDAMRTQAAATKWFTITSAAGMLFMLLFLDLVKYFIAPKYWSGLHVVPMLLMANLLLGVYYNFSIWYRLKDRTGLGAWISVGSAVLTVVLNLVAIPRFGYTGAAWVTLICYLYLSFATWKTGRKPYPVPYEMGKMMGYVVAVLLLWGVEVVLHRFFASHALLIWALRCILMGVFVFGVVRLELWEYVKKRFPAGA